MSFNYNNEVLDLLLKKTLGSAYTSADLVSGQETPVLPKIQNSQIFTNRITDANASNFTWSSTSNVTGGGTVSYLDVVTGETSTFQYIKQVNHQMDLRERKITYKNQEDMERIKYIE